MRIDSRSSSLLVDRSLNLSDLPQPDDRTTTLEEEELFNLAADNLLAETHLDRAQTQTDNPQTTDNQRVMRADRKAISSHTVHPDRNRSRLLKSDKSRWKRSKKNHSVTGRDKRISTKKNNASNQRRTSKQQEARPVEAESTIKKSSMSKNLTVP